MPQALYALTMVFVIALQLLSSELWAQTNTVQTLGQSEQGQAASSDEFLPPEQAFQFSFQQNGRQVNLNWKIAPGYYLYQKRLKVTDSVKQQYPFELLTPAEEKNDPNFGLVKVFHNQLNLSLNKPELIDNKMIIRYQGCSENGLCYPPKRETIYLKSVTTLAASDPVASISTAPVQTALTADQNRLSVEQDAGAIASLLANSEGYWVVLTFLVLGLGLTFTPCVLPMVPILAGIIAGQGEKITVRKGIGLSTVYVLGMSVTYTIAGVLVGYFGAKMNLQASLQSPAALIIFASLFSVLALSMFGFYELQLPSFLRDRLERMGQNSKGGQYISVALMGLISALVVSPCVSAPLAGALVYISTTGDALLGGASLFALSLGMGLPLILVGAGGGQWLPRAGGWMLEVKAFFGVLLLGVAISLLSRLLPGTITLLLWALLAIVYAVHLGSFGQNTLLSGWGKTRRGLSIALLVYGISLLLAGLAGQNDPLRPLAFISGPAAKSIQQEEPLFSRYDSVKALKTAMEQASLQRKPVVIDLYADWCASCKVMEKEVFNRPSVKSFADKIVFLQLDITDNSQEQSAFLQEHGLFGPPSLLFYQADGQELDSARIQGELGPQQFIRQVQKVL